MPGPATTERHAPQLVLNNDLAPTIAEVAGAEIALTVDGRSLVPILRGQAPAWRNAFLIEQYDGSLDTADNSNLGDYPIP